ncbi:2114_t:CDS:1 [Diversispora eburnea]|uniref:2114_t:CDS:1 n=1 Tax=Diversispora eburnea TaxID=1213867 RepID=A0A9N9B915_9GLOM|nr:2114_t:CDS:1 [Diversispora eburnea]
MSYAKSSKNVILTNECFEEIFKYLINDKDTLYSCLFVNRIFCKWVVKILWSQPFTLLKEIPSNKLIQILIDCLRDEEKTDLLKRCTLNFDIFSKKYRQQPLFNYLTFIRELNYWCFFESTNLWLRNILMKQRNNYVNSNLTNVITIYLIKVIMIQGKHIRSLRWFNNDIYRDLPPIRRFPKDALSMVKYLSCGGFHIDDSAFNQLSRTCNNIIELEISHYRKSHDSNLAALIRSQNGLKHITFNYITGGTWRLAAALHSQASTLRSLKFVNIDFVEVNSKGLVVCNNLESLEFFDCHGINIEKFWKPIIDHSNFHLKKLSLARTIILSEVIEKFIITSNSNFEEFMVDRTVTIEMPYLMEMLANNCPNISFLKIFLNNLDEISLLLSCIANFTKLKTLVIRTSACIDVSEILPIFSNLIPSSLQLLDFDMNTSAESLQLFLENCKALIQRIIMNYGYVLEEHIKVLINYVLEKGSLKSIGYTYRTNWTNSDFSEFGLGAKENLQLLEESAKELVDFIDPVDPNDCLFQCFGDSEGWGSSAGLQNTWEDLENLPTWENSL